MFSKTTNGVKQLFLGTLNTDLNVIIINLNIQKAPLCYKVIVYVHNIVSRKSTDDLQHYETSIQKLAQRT
jgi:hypothetical protein